MPPSFRKNQLTRLDFQFRFVYLFIINFARVVNCRMKDEEAGEVPVAFVVKLKNSEVTEDEIKQFISKQACNLTLFS